MKMSVLVFASIGISACAGGGAGVPASAPASASALTAKALALPDVKAPAFLDYLAVDRGAGRVYVPEGSSGSLFVLDVASLSFQRVAGFKTAEREMRGTKRVVGPSAAAVGDGVVYVGDRASNQVCAVDAKSLALGACLDVPQAIDGVAYVASTKEVWVTTPHDQSLTVLDASAPGALEARTVIKLDGEPEGYGVDDGRGLFFTNLEDKGTTQVVDLKTHAPKASWDAGCGEKNVRGLAVDAARGFLYVACIDHVQVLDLNENGARLGSIDAGGGVDNVDYLPSKKLVYVAAGKARRFTVARVDDDGSAHVVATGATAERARNPVADAQGNAYVADATNARVLVFSAP